MRKVVVCITLTLLMLAAPMLSRPLYAGVDEGVTAYERGDFKTALKEFKAEAEEGDAEAQFYLGVIYVIGRGVALDYNEALKWYKKAAEQGFAKAQYNLGVMYHMGRGVARDYEKAINWYEKAAGQGNARAQYNLGEMYNKGEGVIRDYVLSYKWFNLAAAGGDRSARKALDVLEKRMTPGQIAEAQRLSREFKAKGKK